MKTDSIIVTAIGLAAAAVVWWEREAMFQAQALEASARARAVKIEHGLHVSLRQAWSLMDQQMELFREDLGGCQAAADAAQGGDEALRAQAQWLRERVNEVLESERGLNGRVRIQ